MNEKTMIKKENIAAIGEAHRANTEKPIDYTRPLSNAKYERFCQEYMKDSNGAQACIRAGYSGKGANSKGTQLLAIISIKNRLIVLRDKMAQETGISIKMVAEGFRKIATGMLSKALTNKHKLQAYENLGKHTGFYKEDNKQKAEVLRDMFDRLDGQTRGLPQ